MCESLTQWSSCSVSNCLCLTQNKYQQENRIELINLTVCVHLELCPPSLLTGHSQSGTSTKTMASATTASNFDPFQLEVSVGKSCFFCSITTTGKKWHWSGSYRCMPVSGMMPPRFFFFTCTVVLRPPLPRLPSCSILLL